MIAYQDEFGRATRVDYNAFGLIARAYDKEGDLFRCDYDAQGQLVGVTDAAGDQVRYTRPDAQTLIVEDPSAGRRELSFDAEGQVVRERRGEAVLRFRYDEAGRLVARTTPAGEERFTYDSAGRLIAQAGPDGELRYTYDALGRLLSLENRVLFERIGYRYEGSRRQPSEVIYPWGSVRYAYDAAGRLSEVGLGEDRIQIARTADGRRERIRYPNGVETRFRYAGSLLEETASRRGRELLSRRAYAYDDRGRIATVTDEAGRVTRFSHDRRGRLLEAAGDQHLRYAYDAAGNRTSVEVDGARRALEVGEGNRVLALGEVRYTYGDHGALASREDAQGTTRYTVDVDGRLRGVEGPDGRVVRFGYAPDGTPLWREVDGARTRYLVDRDQVVGEFDGGGLRRRYVRGEGLDDLLASEGPDGERLTFHRDLVGSVVALSDAAGEVAARYAYGPFGEALHAEGPAAAGNRWRFAGRPLDPETGLYDVRARHYDPALGRFTSPDPSGREGGLNLYAYAENDPTRLTDPLGLSAELGARLEERTAAPKQSLFGRMLAAVDRAGQSLPGPFRTQYNLLKGVSQAGVDTVVGIGELFKKETWVALGEFVSELDDWETVKAVGKHLADAGIDLGKRYVDAALNDPDEFARMTGYGAGMVIAGVLGTKGIDKLAKVARAAKAARAARRAAEVVDDVADARRATKPVIAVAGGERATTAGASSTAGSTATQTTGTATQTTAGSTAAGTATQESLGSATASRGGIAQALDDSVPLGSGRAAAKRLNERLTKLYDDYFDQDLPDEELVANVKRAIAESDLPDAFKAELADLDDYYALSSVVRDGGEELFALANSSDPALRAYAADLVKARRNYTLGEDKQFRHALKDAERVHGLPAVEATEITNGSGGLGRIFSGQYKGKDAVFKFDRSVDYDTVGEIEEVAKGLEAYGGPEVLGRVRVQDSNGVWREAVAMEKVEGYDLSALLRAKKAGEPLPLEVTPAHTRAIEELTQRLTREGRVLEETNLGDFMLTNDPDRPVVLLDMFVKEGTHRPHGGLLDHNGRPVLETVEGLIGGR
ncbi:MAG: RHS repeat-associated core domain-containing protein [Planctomycetota bacterium]